jgi:hypothetical protein
VTSPQSVCQCGSVFSSSRCCRPAVRNMLYLLKPFPPLPGQWTRVQGEMNPLFDGYDLFVRITLSRRLYEVGPLPRLKFPATSAWLPLWRHCGVFVSHSFNFEKFRRRQTLRPRWTLPFKWPSFCFEGPSENDLSIHRTDSISFAGIRNLNICELKSLLSAVTIDVQRSCLSTC